MSEILCYVWQKPLAGSGGGVYEGSDSTPSPFGLNSFILTEFSANILRNKGVGAHPPRLGNPGSATRNRHFFIQKNHLFDQTLEL